MTLLWVSFLLLVLALLTLDLAVLQRHHHAVSMREAVGWSALWISLGTLFSGVVWLVYDHPEVSGATGPLVGRPQVATMAYLASFLLEKMLSVDNLFVMAVLMRAFRVDPAHQHRVLFWGILGAMLLRGVMIGAGVWLVHRFEWLFYVFGAWLVWTGVRLLWAGDGGGDEEEDPGVTARIARRLLPVDMTDDSGRFWFRANGKIWFTRLSLALIAIELADVVFAVDSVPAVLGVLTPPEAFIVYSSNVFAILGLRALYFVLAAALVRFQYLGYAVAAVLVFVGVRMLLHHVVDLPVSASLVAIVLCLTVGIGASMLAERQTR